MTWYILPSPFFSAVALLPFCSSASLQVQTPLKAIEDGEPQEEDKGSVLPAAMNETWAECKQKLQKVTKLMADLPTEAQAIQGALAAKPHLAGLVEAVKKQTGLFEPKKMEAFSALGLINSLTDQQEMKKHLAQFIRTQVLRLEGTYADH